MEVFKRETAKHYTTKKADVSLFLFYPGVPFAHWKRALPGKMHIYETKD